MISSLGYIHIYVYVDIYVYTHIFIHTHTYIYTPMCTKALILSSALVPTHVAPKADAKEMLLTFEEYIGCEKQQLITIR